MTLALDTLTTLCLAALAWLVLGCSLLLATLVGTYHLVRYLWRRLHSRQVACYNGGTPAEPSEGKVP